MGKGCGRCHNLEPGAGRPVYKDGLNRDLFPTVHRADQGTPCRARTGFSPRDYRQDRLAGRRTGLLLSRRMPTARTALNEIWADLTRRSGQQGPLTLTSSRDARSYFRRSTNGVARSSFLRSLWGNRWALPTTWPWPRRSESADPGRHIPGARHARTTIEAKTVRDLDRCTLRSPRAH